MVATQRSPGEIKELLTIGRPIILVDEVKEAEGDLFCPAEVVTPEILQFMIRRGSGLLCMSMPRDRLEAIGIPRISEGLELLGGIMGVSSYRPPRGVVYPGPHWYKFFASMGDRIAGTPFHFPVDLAVQDSGISVVERLATIKALLDPLADIDWFSTPGHLMTLGAHSAGMAGRWGHTEASVDLCKAVGLEPAGLLCEIIGDDGHMLRGEEMEQFAHETHTEMLSISVIPDLLQA